MVTHILARLGRHCRDKKALMIKGFNDTGIYMPENKSEYITTKDYQPGEIFLGDVTHSDFETGAYEYLSTHRPLL
jgi:hypothetical protein